MTGVSRPGVTCESFIFYLRALTGHPFHIPYCVSLVVEVVTPQTELIDYCVIGLNYILYCSLIL